MNPATLQAIQAMCRSAIDTLDKSWVRCDKDTGVECKGPVCSCPEHRVMITLCSISNELQKLESEVSK